MLRSDASHAYRKAIKEAIETYTRSIRETWEVHDCPVPVSASVASAWINHWGTLRVAWAKADQALEQDSLQCLQDEQWADDGGRNVE